MKWWFKFFLSEENNENWNDIDNEICVSNSNQSWLSKKSLNHILSDVKWNDIFKWTNTIKEIQEIKWDDVFDWTNTIWDYKNVNDNSEWPCENFFCITIDFIIYTHELLGGWQNMSIEYLINRSNKHLKKFASTSLIPATMSTNNFELLFKNLDLPSMFHIWVVITSKPIPILEIEPEDKKEKWKFISTNLLREYYKNIWLEYERKNDIMIFKAKEKELKTIIDSVTISNHEIVEKLEDLKKHKNWKNWKNEFVSKTVLKKVSNDELSNFEKQFLELRKFSSSIKEYVVSVDGIIRQMNKIKIEN